jgi:hypothetical protein
MSFSVPPELEAELDEVTTHYPQKRSASLMFLHAIQERFGCISPEAMEWTARKLGLEPINIYELVTFYPMFRQEKVGKYQIKVCRTLSCALGGSAELREHICRKAGFGRGGARRANHAGRQIHGRICRVPGQLRHRAGDDGQRGFLRRASQRRRRMKCWRSANETEEKG